MHCTNTVPIILLLMAKFQGAGICHRRDTDPSGERIGFGAPLIGYCENNDLLYTGKVGTRYDNETLKNLKNKLKLIEKKSTLSGIAT